MHDRKKTQTFMHLPVGPFREVIEYLNYRVSEDDKWCEEFKTSLTFAELQIDQFWYKVYK